MAATVRTIFILSLCFIVTITIYSCKKKQAVGTDRQLYEMARDTAGFT